MSLPVPVQLEDGNEEDEEEEDDEEGEDDEDGEPGEAGEPGEGGEGESQPSAAVAEREGEEGGVAEGEANHDERGGGEVQMQHLGPVEDAERLSSSSPSSLFRLVVR